MAHEQLLTAQLSRLPGWPATSIPAPRAAPDAVAVTLTGERHDFGALLVAVEAAEEDWRVTYLGTNRSSRDRSPWSRELRDARVVLFSSVAGGAGDLEVKLKGWTEALPRGLAAYMGAAAAGRKRAGITAAGAIWIESLAHLRLALRNLDEEEPNESACGGDRKRFRGARGGDSAAQEGL